MSMYSGEELMCKDHGGKGCGSVLECLLMIRKTQVTEQMWSSKLRWHWGQEHKHSCQGRPLGVVRVWEGAGVAASGD